MCESSNLKFSGATWARYEGRRFFNYSVSRGVVVSLPLSGGVVYTDYSLLISCIMDKKKIMPLASEDS